MMRRLLVGIVLVFAFGCAEQFESRFETGAAALSSDEARRGWVPQWLPAAATRVIIRYDIDTNEVWLTFLIERSEREALVRDLEPVSWQAVPNIRIRKPRGAPWWPEGLIQRQPANDAALNAEVFRGADRVVLLNRVGLDIFAYVFGQ